MPIPVSRLKEQSASLSDRILEFLRKDPTQAFTANEIYGGIEGLEDSALAVFLVVLMTGKPGRLDEIQRTLETLSREGLVQAAQHHGTTYYAIIKKQP